MHAVICDTCGKIGELAMRQFGMSPPDGWQVQTPYKDAKTSEPLWETCSSATMGDMRLTKHRCPWCEAKRVEAEKTATERDELVEDLRKAVRDELEKLLPRRVTCRECNGHGGSAAASGADCPRCLGTGFER